MSTPADQKTNLVVGGLVVMFLGLAASFAFAPNPAPVRQDPALTKVVTPAPKVATLRISAPQLVASGEVEIAAQQMPELHAVAGVDPTPLPDELQLIIPFVVGVSAAPQDAKATEELVAFFTGPAAGAVLKSKGLNPP